MNHPIVVGAVAYDQRVVPIWEAMRDYFRETGVPIDYVLFSNYDSQVQALLARQVDIAWNTNLAWAKVHHRTGGACRALAMRDADAGFTTIFVAHADSGVQRLADLRGRRLALGSADSAQAAILPLHFVAQAGLDPQEDCTLVRYDLDVGKHGDTGTSELEVVRALQERHADVGALGDTTWTRLLAEGKIDPRQLRAIWTSPGYCHCNFSVLGDFDVPRGLRWTEALLGMEYSSPRWRPLMDLEGLKRWIPATPEIMQGYRLLFDAIAAQGLARDWSSP